MDSPRTQGGGPRRRGHVLRRQGRRLAWLMAGAAIGLAVVLLVMVATIVVTGRGAPRSVPLGAITLLSALLAALLGLVPGVRELEVTGARAMLGADGELLVPRHTRPLHHLQICLWVVLHLGTGLVVAVVLATLVPSAALHLVELARGRALGSGLPLPSGAPARWGVGALTLTTGLALLVCWWPLGVWLARLAPRFLGPTAADRLQLVQQRADREAERTRIARELHDGIGHALTVVSIQAAAARAVHTRDPEAAAAALAAIEETARSATGELDAVLALLREDQAPPHRGQGRTPPPPGRDEISTLLADHHRAGADVHVEGEVPVLLPAVQSHHLQRCLAELLTNAQRHGGPGPVRVRFSTSAGHLRLEVRNPLADPSEKVRVDARGGGRGLRGLAERAALLAGTITAGPQGGDWVARVDLPLLADPPQDTTR